MNNETDLQSGTADGNSTRVITFQSNSTPLATDIDNFSLEQYTNQLSTTATSTLVEGLLNSVSEAISDAVGNITSSLSGNESASLHSSLASNSGNFPVIHNETIGNTAENFLPGGSSKEACVLLNTFIFLLPFLSLLIIIPLAAFLYDKTPLGTCYNRVCDLLCGIPEEDEQDNGDGNETYGDIEKGAYAGGTRRTNSDHRDCAKNKKKKKKHRRRRNSYNFRNPAFTESYVRELGVTYWGNEIGNNFFNPSLHETYVNTLTGVGEDKDHNGNDNRGTPTDKRKYKENDAVEGIGHVNSAFYSPSLESGANNFEEIHL
ncbi:conserved Plasmodium protein, unknown function [Plasmodium knowlesi strain H]|uniref:Uncharacterized protein n=3 Tax=Plasmodium knowlesi TaxID=5850 RepID=A0A5E7WY72_PLAKH|nr:conserved Plasmodium protein, unknown function [Plasmodium knowlesi strain H]OTN68545.1 Uncharacterized protein PKNOH_S02313800 [Plasmodium knowlesi]CAA9986637.1 conserved Plasmodium protein, unknown function [Plasmodium knowlesi strain H]SBO24081.1 conserved Plasmodium protein, unknown function [Plasmodium knowlesi strain H]SBO29347.1 conserved Plasmodium protein, unknown function [Plasmodium knowlesi strain H]VVS76111.1 conserved Plasmodium protein, unknown function [Plasmodium knowlesi s